MNDKTLSFYTLIHRYQSESCKKVWWIENSMHDLETMV